MTTKPPSTTLPQCDCLNDCGDDPRIDRGTARPCQVHINYLRAKHLQNAAADLLAALQALVKDQRDASLPVLAQAREVIAKATKGTQA